MLSHLGLYGYDSVETAILAGLVTGDPVLLVGGHGTAKTTLCRRIGEAMGLKFWAYDASKALFEDVLGFPNPASISKGQIEYVPTPISIWDKEFVLVDELSRATPSMQSKWLEVVRSRQIMGCRLPKLRHVFSAMNPPSYLGAHPLDEALASRFAVVVRVPDVWQMEEEDLRRVITERTEDDAPALGPCARPAAAASENLIALITEARGRVARLAKSTKDRLRTYVVEVGRFLASRDLPLDGRRLGMMWRTLQACLVVDATQGDNARVRFQDSDSRLHAALPCVLPFDALESKASAVLLRAAHECAWAAARGRKRAALASLPRDPIDALSEFESHHRSAQPQERQAAITAFLAKAKATASAEISGRAIAAVLRLAHGVCKGELDLCPDDQYRLLESFRGLTHANRECVSELCQEIGLESAAFRAIGIRDHRNLLALRAAFSTLKADGSRSADAAEIVDLTQAIASALDECQS